MARFTIQDVTDWTLGNASEEARAAIEADVAPGGDGLVCEYLEWLAGTPNRPTPRLVQEDVNSLSQEKQIAMENLSFAEDGLDIGVPVTHAVSPQRSLAEIHAGRTAQPANAKQVYSVRDTQPFLVLSEPRPENLPVPLRPLITFARIVNAVVRHSRVATARASLVGAGILMTAFFFGPDLAKQRFNQLVARNSEQEAALAKLDERVRKSKSPLNKNALEVRALRAEIQDWRRKFAPMEDMSALSLGAFVRLTERRGDRESDLALEAAILTRNKGADMPIYCQDDQLVEDLRQEIHDVTLKKVTPNPVILDLAMRIRTPDEPLGLLVPAYFNPQSEKVWKEEWGKIFAARRAGLNVIAIINIGVKADDKFRKNHTYNTYNQTVEDANKQGVSVIAYVDVLPDGPDRKFGDQQDGGVEGSKERIKREIDHLCDLFKGIDETKGIDGIFLDNQPTDDRFAVPFQEIKEYVMKDKSKKFVVSNPRRHSPGGYLLDSPILLADDKQDITILAYSDADPILYSPPGWTAKYPPKRFAGWFWGLHDPGSLPAQLRHAAARHLGWIYISDPATYNPGNFKTLPPDWEAALKALERLNEAIETGVEPVIPRIAP
jgi:Spherulation-specific family 4